LEISCKIIKPVVGQNYLKNLGPHSFILPFSFSSFFFFLRNFHFHFVPAILSTWAESSPSPPRSLSLGPRPATPFPRGPWPVSARPLHPRSLFPRGASPSRLPLTRNRHAGPSSQLSPVSPTSGARPSSSTSRRLLSPSDLLPSCSAAHESGRDSDHRPPRFSAEPTPRSPCAQSYCPFLLCSSHQSRPRAKTPAAMSGKTSSTARHLSLSVL
jgi:hypothetical protein